MCCEAAGGSAGLHSVPDKVQVKKIFRFFSIFSTIFWGEENEVLDSGGGSFASEKGLVRG
jgi:hypothetical protein